MLICFFEDLPIPPTSCLTLVAFLLSGTMAFALAAAPASSLPLSQAGVVQMKAQPALKKNVDAFPRLVPGTGVSASVAAIVNRHLAALDAEALKARLDCIDMAHDEQSAADFTRTAEVTLRGPRFLSVTSTSDYFCGGAHPDNDSISVVYDLQTGSPVNWLRYLPKEAHADGSFVVWPALKRMSVNSASSDCTDVVKGNDSGYTMSLTHDGKLIAQPGQSSHATQGCDEALVLDLATAQKLGVSPALLQVLKAAAATRQ